MIRAVARTVPDFRDAMSAVHFVKHRSVRPHITIVVPVAGFQTKNCLRGPGARSNRTWFLRIVY